MSGKLERRLPTTDIAGKKELAEPLQVKFGEPFSIYPHLEPPDKTRLVRIPDETETGFLLDSIPFNVEELNTEGRIDVVEYHPKITAWGNRPILAPLGPALPLSVIVHFDHLPVEQIPSIGVDLVFNFGEKNRTIEGKPSYDDVSEESWLAFFTWKDPETDNESQLVLPPNPTIFNQMQIIITRDQDSKEKFT